LSLSNCLWRYFTQTKKTKKEEEEEPENEKKNMNMKITKVKRKKYMPAFSSFFLCFFSAKSENSSLM
jgi:hypothetical protein